MRAIMSMEAVKSHLLFCLWRAKEPVRIGDLKSKMLGTEISTEDALKTLWDLNQIVYKEDNKLELSEEGRYRMDQMVQAEAKRMQPLLFDKQIDLAILGLLYHRPHLVHDEDFPKLLNDYAGNLHHEIFKLGKYIEKPFMNWYQLTEVGRAYYEHQLQKSNVTTLKQSGDDSHLCAADKQEMNAKLDKLMEVMTSEINDVKLGQELTYTDIMEELNELRQRYDLPKKTWRQLLTGKLTEMTVSGIVSETLSKRIADFINPALEKLLE